MKELAPETRDEIAEEVGSDIRLEWKLPEPEVASLQSAPCRQTLRLSPVVLVVVGLAAAGFVEEIGAVWSVARCQRFEEAVSAHSTGVSEEPLSRQPALLRRGSLPRC